MSLGRLHHAEGEGGREVSSFRLNLPACGTVLIQDGLICALANEIFTKLLVAIGKAVVEARVTTLVLRIDVGAES